MSVLQPTKGTDAGDCELWRGVPSFAVASVLPAARDCANPNRHGGEAFGVRTTWGWVQ